jgi:RNA polymerase sigma-32 factor
MRYRHAAREEPFLTAARERALLELAQAGDQHATDELVRSHMRLVVQVASSYGRGGLSVHDLVSEGVLGLMEAIRRFDLARDSRFASYATWWVRACVRQHALANRHIVRMPDTRGARVARSRLRESERNLSQLFGRKPTHAELAADLGVSEHDVELVDVALSGRDQSLAPADNHTNPAEPEDGHETPEEAMANAEYKALQIAQVRRAVAQLTERERELVSEHLYAEDGQSLACLGRALGVSRQRAGQILAGAREKLRTQLHCVA